MNGDYKVNVTKVTEQSAFDHQGKLAPVIRVEYMIGEHGPFSENFPKDQFSAAAAQTKLAQMASMLRQLAS